MGNLQELRGVAGRVRARAAAIGRAGAVAIITAVTAPLLLMIVGFAADFGYASYINQRLAKATDAATLAGVSQSAATAAGGYGNVSWLQTYGTNVFNANVASLGLSNVGFSLSVVSDGSGGVIASGSYTYSSPTTFAGILGFGTIPLSGNAKTTARPPTYVNYYILVDATQSMGIGSTPADMAALYSRVAAYQNAGSNDIGCVFGCHVKQPITVNGHTYTQPYTNEDLAHNLTRNFGSKITLRIDSAVTAIQNIISSAATIAGTVKNIKFGLYTIAADPTTGKRVQIVMDPPTTDYTSLQTAAGTITLGNIYSNTTGQTDFHNEILDFLSGLNPSMTQGSGASAASPLNYVFLITDGLTDMPGNCNIFYVCTSALNSNDCAPLKANATVGVIYTTYNPIYQFNTAPTKENRYDTTNADQAQPNLNPALQACATSSDWFFEAQDGPTLVSAVQTLFERTQPISARLTQ